MSNPLTEREWKQAKGKCGYAVDGPVFGAYVNGVALFAFKHDLGTTDPDWHTCVVCGQLSTGGPNLLAAQLSGAFYALKYGRVEADRIVTLEKFDDIMNKED